MILHAPVSRAWGALPVNDEGPCSVPCGHGSCAAQIQFAAECCLFCNQPVGYENDFIELYDGRVVHVHCPVRPVVLAKPPSLWRRFTRLFK